MASTRFYWPPPLGPTTPVRPGSILNSVGSQKLLNPARRSRSNFMGAALSALLAATLQPIGHAATSRSPNQGRKLRILCETVLFRRRIDNAVEVGNRQVASQFVAVDEKSRRRIDVERCGGALAALANPPVEILVSQTGLGIGLRYSV